MKSDDTEACNTTPSGGVSHRSPPLIRAVLFDFDGTLTKPNAIDFAAIKSDLGCPQDQPILEFVEVLSAEAKRNALEILNEHEVASAERSEANDGVEELVAFLRSRDVPIGILSRNSMRSVVRSIDNFPSTETEHFNVILSRDEAKPKPSPDGVLRAASTLDVSVESLLVVGDYVFDIEAARNAGAPSVLLTNGSPPPPEWRPDYIVHNLGELTKLIDSLLPLETGKLPNRFLQKFLSAGTSHDECVLIAPGLGEDTAAVALTAEDEVLVLKSDPITFSADHIGLSTVVINANDIATAGATPRWLLTTLLFPPGTNAARIGAVIEEFQHACQSFGVSLCGGHTEITEAVTQPVAVGQMVGTVTRERLINKNRMTHGDHILLTKAIALEGASILARDFGPTLVRLGMSSVEVETARRLIFEPGVSVLEEAHLATVHGDVTAMHDVTEGGLATALLELSIAGGHGLRVDIAEIPVLPECVTMCSLLGVDPLGLIGSGSLLIASRPESSNSLLKALRSAGIEVTRIGEVDNTPPGIQAVDGTTCVEWPQFEVDEISRAITKLAALE